MSEEDWVRAVDTHPRAYRDVASVRRLISGSLSADDPGLRVLSVNALCRVVKALEVDEVTESREAIQDALPQMVDGLLIEEGNINGCTISIMRRVVSNERSVARILALLDETLDDRSLLIEALSLHDWRVWPRRVEEVFAENLSHAPHSAGYALYCGVRHIRLKETAYALREAAREDRHWQGRYYGLLTLCCLTQARKLSKLALSLLNDVLTSASERSRKDVAEALGWSTRRGLPLLRRLAEDESSVVRQAVVHSCGREEYRSEPVAREILVILCSDKDASVRNAAVEAKRSL